MSVNNTNDTTGFSRKPPLVPPATNAQTTYRHAAHAPTQAWTTGAGSVPAAQVLATLWSTHSSPSDALPGLQLEAVHNDPHVEAAWWRCSSELDENEAGAAAAGGMGPLHVSPPPSQHCDPYKALTRAFVAAAGGTLTTEVGHDADFIDWDTPSQQQLEGHNVAGGPTLTSPTMGDTPAASPGDQAGAEDTVYDADDGQALLPTHCWPGAEPPATPGEGSTVTPVAAAMGLSASSSMPAARGGRWRGFGKQRTMSPLEAQRHKKNALWSRHNGEKTAAEVLSLFEKINTWVEKHATPADRGDRGATTTTAARGADSTTIQLTLDQAVAAARAYSVHDRVPDIIKLLGDAKNSNSSHAEFMRQAWWAPIQATITLASLADMLYHFNGEPPPFSDSVARAVLSLIKMCVRPNRTTALDKDESAISKGLRVRGVADDVARAWLAAINDRLKMVMVRQPYLFGMTAAPPTDGPGDTHGHGPSQEDGNDDGGAAA
jgi:hypothetical protein